MDQHTYSQYPWASNLAFWILAEPMFPEDFDAQEHATWVLFYTALPNEIIWS